MKWSLQGKWIAVGFTLTLLLMSLVVFGSFNNTSEIKQSANRVNHTYKTLNTLTNFYAAMTVAESARRGYIFMGSKQDLDRYENALTNIHHELKLLGKQIHSSRSQQERFTIFNSLVNQRLALLEKSIQIYQKDKNAIQSQTEITERSVKIREQILPLISDIKAEEQDYLQNSLQESEYIIHSRIVIEILATFLIIVVISCLCIILERQWVKRDKIKSLESSLFQEKKIGEMKVQLFSMVSHEFRTPLSVILLSAQLLTEALKDVLNEIQFKNLSRIQYSAKLMNHMLTDILTLTRAEAGKLDCKTQLINIEDFCLNLVEDIQVFNPVTHKIIFINESGIFRGYLDEKLLYSMLTNLLLNAIKYSDIGSQIFLILKSEPKFIIFQVIDKGIGISLTEQQKIYEPFYRCQNVDNIVGSGLGLSVVKKCVECHQGEINLESQVGIGTIFTIKIPHSNTE